jgi:hypothetical protein
MQAEQCASPDPIAVRERVSTELQTLREHCRRLNRQVDTLTETVAVFRKGAHGLSVENAELRAQIALMQAIVHARCPLPGADVLETRLPGGRTAAAASRSALADFLRDRVPYGVLDRAQLIVSELLADSNGNGNGNGAVHAPVILRIETSDTTLKLELDDPDRSDLLTDTGEHSRLGLSVMEQLSERWGGERLTGGGMRVWAQLTLLDQGAGA